MGNSGKLIVIVSSEYIIYDDALMTHKLKSLKDRRKKLCLKLAKKCLIIDKFKKFSTKQERSLYFNEK